MDMKASTVKRTSTSVKSDARLLMDEAEQQLFPQQRELQGRGRGVKGKGGT